MNSRYVLGVDIGGTKIAVGLVDAGGKQVAGGRIPTLAGEGPERVIDRLLALCRQVLDDAAVPTEQIAGIGISCAGPIDMEKGLIKTAPNLPGWSDVPLVSIFEEALHIPTFLENDANAAAVGEYRFGAGRGHRNMVYMTVSTGVGGGVVLDGRLYRGETGAAAELGHTVIAYDGRACNCGGRGCLEAYASGTGLAKRAQEMIAEGAQSILPDLAGGVENITAEVIVEAVRRGDEAASRLWNETMEILGIGVASVVNTFNPSIVVIGGGLTNAGELLFDPVRRVAKERAMPPLAAVVEIVPATLGGIVGVVGAAAAVFDRLDASGTDTLRAGV